MDEFIGDMRGLSKKYRGIEDDVDRFKKALASDLESGLLPKSFKPGEIQGADPCGDLGKLKAPIYKYRKLVYSKNSGLRGRFRVIYAYESDPSHCANSCAPNSSAVCRLIEIYFKNGKSNQDYDRIYKYYGRHE